MRGNTQHLEVSLGHPLTNGTENYYIWIIYSSTWVPYVEKLDT